MESAQGKFHLLDWESYQPGGNFATPHPIPPFTYWEARLRAAMSTQRNKHAFNRSPFIKAACNQRDTPGTEHQGVLTGMKIMSCHSTSAHT